jgi:hypothetical protein
MIEEALPNADGNYAPQRIISLCRHHNASLIYQRLIKNKTAYDDVIIT